MKEARFQRWLREPLLHFLLLGLVLFVAYDWMHGNRDSDSNRIVVDDSIVADIVQRHTATWQRPPTQQELQGLIETYIRDEVFYREGVALGLQNDDVVVRRRVQQKLTVMTEESGRQTPPTETDLQNYLAQHAERYAQPAELSFEQVFFDPTSHREKLDAEIAAALTKLNGGADSASIGDRTLLPQRATQISSADVARDFGEDFTATLIALSPGDWKGPVQSAFGVHLVRVTEHLAGRVAQLTDVRAAVERDWENDRRIAASNAFYHNARKGYRIDIKSDLIAIKNRKVASQ